MYVLCLCMVENKNTMRFSKQNRNDTLVTGKGVHFASTEAKRIKTDIHSLAHILCGKFVLLSFVVSIYIYCFGGYLEAFIRWLDPCLSVRNELLLVLLSMVMVSTFGFFIVTWFTCIQFWSFSIPISHLLGCSFVWSFSCCATLLCFTLIFIENTSMGCLMRPANLNQTASHHNEKDKITKKINK